MAAQTKRVLVPRLNDCFEDLVIDVAILEGFQKLEYDHPTQEQAQAVRSFVLGSDAFVMPPTGSGIRMTFVLNETEMRSYIKKLESVVCQVEREDHGADSGIKFYPGCQFWSWSFNDIRSYKLVFHELTS